MHVQELSSFGAVFVILMVVSCADPVTVEGPESLPSGMEFVTIPSGSFSMGSPTSDPDSNDDERPVHTVTFSYSFEMMTTEVTQGMWEELLNEEPGGWIADDYPVRWVNWDNCQDFVDAMNDLDPAHEYRLPSEAEWEYCCRAGSTTRFYWGDDPSYELIDLYAWYWPNPDTTAQRVAQKLPSNWMLYDMSGNMGEWCLDWYHEDYGDAPSDGSAWLIPTSSDRVVRGGSWYSGSFECRSAARDFGEGPTALGRGFRLVRTVR